MTMTRLAYRRANGVRPRVTVLAFLVVLVAGLSGLPACGNTAEKTVTAPVVGTVVQETMIQLDQQRVVMLGSGARATTVDLPALPSRATVTVRLVSGVMKAGATPAGDVVHVATADVTFAPTAKMRQAVPPPPVGKAYVAVTATDDGAWVTRAPARAIAAATIAPDGPAPAPAAYYEIDVLGSGLWAIAVQDPSGAIDTCIPSNVGGCAPGLSCGLVCRQNASLYSCQTSGVKKQGELCRAGECEPGTQCMATGCNNVLVCNRLCRSDADCGATRCLTAPVSCGGMATDVRICAHACDPRGAATTGCAAGLNCLIFADEIATCDCAPPTRSRVDGEACAAGDECRPGLLCVAAQTGTGNVCRPVCQLGAADCEPGRTCSELRTPPYVTWGVCVP